MNKNAHFDIEGVCPVAIATGGACYASMPPFSPAQAYPEYPFREHLGGQSNPAYEQARQALALLGFDRERFGSPAWNPLGEVIEPGQVVVVKPNLVRDFRETQEGDGDCTITHGSIIRVVCDYVYIALQGRGRIVVADAPHNDADFKHIRRIAGLDELQRFYRETCGFPIEVYDLRPEQADKIDGVIVGHSKLPGDPAGYVRCNLGVHSAFHEINHLCHLLYGSEYDMGELHSHQHDDIHEYLISKTVLAADCVIGLPKLKTHKKVALTVNLKNLVGINGNKNWLPHHREGTPRQGGDQFADDSIKRRVERVAVSQFKRLFPLLGPLRPFLAGPIKAAGKGVFGDTNTDAIRSGNWHGNDTTWRMALDLNRILIYADAEGHLLQKPVRRFLSVVDGIMAGEGNGPLDPVPRACGLVVAGLNPVAVDTACGRLMGFDYCRIPLLREGLGRHRYPLCRATYDQIRCASNDPRFNTGLAQIEGACFAFQPHFGWRGHVEWASQPGSGPHGDVRQSDRVHCEAVPAHAVR